MKRTEPKSFAEIFDENMARAGASDTMARHQACFLWPEIVGPGINKYTYKRYVDDTGCLHVYVSSAPLKNELSYMRSQLVEQINKAVGSQALTDINLFIKR